MKITLSSEEITKLKAQAAGVMILINGYLRYLRSRCSSVRELEGSYSVALDLFDDFPL